MNLEQQRRLFDACLDVDEGAREQLLQSCPDNELRESVRSLLRAHESATRSSYPLFAEAEFPHIAAPHQVGPYRILERIGEGAMGDVFLADQQSPVRRRVALKIIKFGLASREVIARFELERQTLALLTHQNIARFYDAGSTEDGRPYFAMEYVPGIPITRYCDERRLGIQARLQLFAQVCAGVQHAHLRGVIHRDLKPTNILVAEVDGAPVPKIIDFGIAKATTAVATSDEVYTRFGNLLGTPEYMSPEQAQLSPLDIDARTDVYSLGIILYQLLAGSRPYAVTGDAVNPAIILNEILNKEIKRPSESVQQASDDVQQRAAVRGESPQSLAAVLQEDLDWIVLKAINRNRQQRYESAAALADDLQRYANHEPVIAGPPSTGYRLRKFVRRHRLGVTALAATFIAAIVFGSAMAWLAIVASEQRDRANQEAQVARRVTAFTAGLFELANPVKTGSNTTSTRDLLDMGVRRLENQVALEKPDVRAALLESAASAYRGLGALAEAERLLREALSIREQERALAPEAHAATLIELAYIKREQGELDDAAKIATQASDEVRDMNNADLAARAEIALAAVRLNQSKLDEAAGLADHAASSAPSAKTKELALMTLAAARKAQGQLEAAEKLYRDLYNAQSRDEGPLAETTLNTKNGLAIVLETMGKSDLAEPLLRELVDDTRKIYGDRHAAYGVAMNDLANAISDMPAKRDEAAQLYMRAIDILRGALGPQHPEVGTTYNNLGALFVRTQQWRKADETFVQAIAIRSAALGPRHPDTAGSMHGRALALMKLNRFPEAESLLRESAAIYTEALGADHWRTGNARLYLGFALANRGDRAGATQEMQSGFRLMSQSLGADHWRVEGARNLMSQVQVATP